MNAYELANKMEQLAGHFHNEAINMLRQQADRIVELEKAFVNQRTQGFANSLFEGTKASAMLQVRITELEGELSRYELRDLEHTSRIAELEKLLEEANSVLDTIDCGDSIK